MLAVLLGWITDVNPFATLRFSEIGLIIGIAATLPLLILLLVIQELPYRAIQDIQYMLTRTLGPSLQNKHWTDLFILSAVAGFSEEVLFRGFLQPWLENSLDQTAALVVSNLIFALAHAITPIYALIAMLIGLYLGVCLDYHGERNLLIPMVIHTIYDFAAFILILRKYRQYKHT